MITPTPHPTLDYLVIGHVSRDRIAPDSEAYTIGGTVSFSSQIAVALGYRPAVLTSAAPDFDIAPHLPETVITSVPAAHTTTFSNIYTPHGRQQIVHQLAGAITPYHLPADWRTIPIVHLGPITNRIDPDLVNAFEGSFIGITPQGWMREWDEDGTVRPTAMTAAEILLPAADAVVIGEEDLHDAAVLGRLTALAKLLVVTRSARGCTVYQHGHARDFPAPAVQERNATGAGDTFATAFFIYLHETGDVALAAEQANRIASLSVTQPDLPSKMAAINQAISQPIAVSL